MWVDLEVAHVAVDPFVAAPVLVLRERSGTRRLSLPVGRGEAVSLLAALERIPLVGGGSSELFLGAISRLGGAVDRVELFLGGEVVQARVVIRSLGRGQEFAVPATLRDAVMLSLRGKTPLRGEAALFARALGDGTELSNEWFGSPESLESLADDAFPPYKM